MRARFSGFLIAVALLLPAADQAAERRPIVAVFDVEAKGIELSVDLLERLSEYLSSRLAETGRYMVIPRDDLKKRLLGQKSESYKQCYDSSCQIEMGREMAADKTIATQVIKFGSRCMLTSTLYDLKKAATEIAATVRGKCGEEEIVNSLDKVVDKLSGKKDGVAQGGGGVFSKPEEKEVDKLSERAGEVKQPGTDLYWMRCPLGQTWSGSSCQGDMIKKDWAQAIKACPAGYWLPTRQEFLNLLGGCDEKVRGGGQGHCESCGKSARCSSMFREDVKLYWSSSSYAGASSEAWAVSFDIGLVYTNVKVYSFFNVRCVRRGP